MVIEIIGKYGEINFLNGGIYKIIPRNMLKAENIK